MSMALLSIVKRCELPALQHSQHGLRSFNQLMRLSKHPLRRKTTAAVEKAGTQKAYLYPERLLIYHAGTGRTVFIGCMKVTTIFVFGFFATVVAPAHFYSPDEPKWISVLACGSHARTRKKARHLLILQVLLSGTVPFLFVAYTTRAFVTYVHLRLPPYARKSREFLHRYAANLPKTASVDITTMNLIGKPRASRINAGELYPVKRQLSVADYARDTRKLNATRPWWMGRAVGEFAIRGVAGGVREKGIWEKVESSIRKLAASSSRAR